MIDVWAFGIPFIDISSRRKRRAANKFLDVVIKPLDGFLGMSIAENDGLILLFDTENNAKIGRNVLRSHNIPCGNNIVKAKINPTEG